MENVFKNEELYIMNEATCFWISYSFFQMYDGVYDMGLTVYTVIVFICNIKVSTDTGLWEGGLLKVIIDIKYH